MESTRSARDDGPPTLDEPTQASLELARARRRREPLQILQVIPTLTVGGAEKMVALLARYLRRSAHTVGVVSMYDPFDTGIEADRQRQVPLFLAEQETGRVDRALRQIAVRAVVVPVAIGQAVAESMRRVYRLSARHIIPNGIPVSDYATPRGARDEVRASLWVPFDAPTFVAVGRLELQKDPEPLLRDLARIGRRQRARSHVSQA